MRKPEGKSHLEDPGVDNIKIDLQELGWEHGLDRSGSGYGEAVGSSECGKELPGCIKSGEFLD